jgi:hypothetical protein
MANTCFGVKGLSAMGKFPPWQLWDYYGDLMSDIDFASRRTKVISRQQ